MLSLYHDRDIKTIMNKPNTDKLNSDPDLKQPKTYLSLSKKVLPVAKVILIVLREIGEITVKSFFPPQYAKKYGYSSLYRKNYHNSLGYLKRKGLVDVKNGIYRLTGRGEKEAFFAYLNGEVNVHKNHRSEDKKWDKKWRLILFDIPEKKRHYRDYLRAIIKTMGFKEFQKSIWIYPHPIPSFLKDLLFEEKIKQYTRFITTYDIEYDKDLRKLFNL